MARIKSTAIWTTIAAAVVSAIVLVFVPSAAVESVYPAARLRLAWDRQVRTRFAGIFDHARLAAENRRLRREIDALKVIGGEVERLERENAQLRKVLDYSSKATGTWVAAAVLSRGGGASAPRRTLRVDCGSLKGAREGAVVMAADGLVGRVTAVTPHTAEVTTIADGSVKADCEIDTGSANPPRGVLLGGEETLTLGYLRNFRGAEPLARSRVVTSGRGGVFPRGLEVGAWMGLVSRPGELPVGEVLPAVDFEALEDVFIRCEK